MNLNKFGFFMFSTLCFQIGGPTLLILFYLLFFLLVKKKERHMCFLRLVIKLVYVDRLVRTPRTYLQAAS